jgi:dienelactone hydrolase
MQSFGRISRVNIVQQVIQQMSVINRRRLTAQVANTRSKAIAGYDVSGAYTNQSDSRLAIQTIEVKLSTGAAKVDLYWFDTAVSAPLIIIAHGFFRRRRNMSGWGLHLAKEGFVAVVPDLPTMSDHARNGCFISELRRYLCTVDSLRQPVDPARVGLMGFSAGGLVTLLSAADDPGLAVWVGLDPVDWNGIGAQAASKISCRAVVLTAEPSACNAHGNASNIIAAMPHCEHFKVIGAVHVDAEWPTDWMAEIVCGRSRQDRRDEFHRRAIAAFRESLLIPPPA